MEPIRVAVRRSGTVESVHRVHAVAVRNGDVAAAAGDPALVTFLRSSAKPVQALLLVRARPELDDRLVAIASASHHAEPEQIEAVRALLAEVTAAAGAAPATATDGCGVVTFGLSLERMAAAFARLGDLDGGGRVLAAMGAHPQLVGGADSLDTRLMRALPGWVAKGGAEGLICGVGADGAGFALKVGDGNQRALAPALASFFPGLDEFARVPVTNSRGEEVGEVACL